MNNMTTESQLLETLYPLLKRKDAQDVMLQTDTALIIPAGCGTAYSINHKGFVNGIKLSDIPGENIQQIFQIIIQFKELERLVLYSDNSIEIPIHLSSLSKLKYIVINTPKVIPTSILEKYEIRFFSEVFTSRSKSQRLINSKFDEFKRKNNGIDIGFKYHELMRPWKYEGDASYIEAQLYCCTTKIARTKYLAQNGIYVNSIDNLIDPPAEVVMQGSEAILQYCRDKKKQGAERLYEAKIVIVGAGESGKTTLIQKLKNPHHKVPNAEDKRTEGIRVTTYPFKGYKESDKLNMIAHIWDFGGQELYHTTHQLFLTADTLYILLNDNRKNDTDFYYWLNVVTLRAGNSPILMVFNAKDNATRQIIPGEEIFNAFPNLIKESIDINFADKDITLIEKMKATIEGHFSKLEVLGKPFPSFWVRVREDLNRLSNEHISWNEFASICAKNGINDVAKMRILAVTLNNLGVLLYFPNVFGLQDLIILKSQWCVDAIYSALDTKEIIDNGGKFDEKTLAEKWAGDRYAGNHLQLLRIMQHFDLCYQIDGTEYIAPQLLPLDERRLPNSPSSWNIIFQFQYQFMPAGLVTRLIARMSRYIKDQCAWRTGVILEWDDKTIAEIIEHQLTRKIVVKINGQQSGYRLLEIRKCLYNLHTEFKGIKFDEYVTCNCADCREGGDVTIFELRDLEDDAEHNDNVKCKNGTRKHISAKSVLNGISYTDIPKVFISYSHKNERLKHEFRTMIAPMENEGHWKVWDDRWLLPGDKWNEEIMRHLDEANVIVLMLTSEFFKSDFIYNIELKKAIKKHETGDALLIGIIVDDCMWEETPLKSIQMLPKDGRPIEKNKNRNEVWKLVASKIKETIKVKQGTSLRKGGW